MQTTKGFPEVAGFREGTLKVYLCLVRTPECRLYLLWRMADDTKWRCPVCGSPLTGERLELTEDDGAVAVVYDFRCPNRDFRLVITEPELRRAASELVFERLRQG